MKKRNALRAISAVTSASTLLASVAAAEANIAASAVLEESESVSYDKVAHIEGAFSYTQDVMSPASEIFNLFGTAATGLCAKPNFALENGEEDEKYLINIGGKIKQDQTISLAQLKRENGTNRTMVCSCATSASVAQGSITGARVADLLTLAGVEEDANTISFISADGYKSSLPLKYVLDKDALLVYDIAGEGNPSGVQVWMPSTVSRYFTRQVAEIELSAQDPVPVVEKADADYRAKVSILNHVEDTLAVGDTITFEGYADDCGVAIAAIEFSLDGENWTTCPVHDANPDKWVNWSFEYAAAQAGTYKLDVRAVTADGTVSPLSSSVVFTVG